MKKRGSLRRPPAVPEPPKSLITLLKKNGSVLNYFTLLQQNLEYDVKHWKQKARYYKQQYQNLLSSQAQSQPSNSTTKNPNGIEDKQNVANVSTMNDTDNSKLVSSSSIQDQMFDQELSSSSSSSNQDEFQIFNECSRKTKCDNDEMPNIITIETSRKRKHEDEDSLI